MDVLTKTLIPITFFLLIGFIVYHTNRNNYLLKKAIVDKGGDYKFPKKRFPGLEIGITMLGFGLGLAAATIPQSMNLEEETQELLTGACVIFFSGLGFLSAYLIRKKVDDKSDK